MDSIGSFLRGRIALAPSAKSKIDNNLWNSIYNFESRCGGGKFGAFKGGKTEKCTVTFFDEARAVAKDSVWADDRIRRSNVSPMFRRIIIKAEQIFLVFFKTFRCFRIFFSESFYK